MTYEGRRRVTAVTAYGVTLGLAAVLGQLFGGLLIQANVLGLDWRSCFLVNLPVGVAALVATPRLVAESRGNAADRIDLVGTVLVTAGLVAIILPLVDGRQQHWPAWAWACLAAAAPILAGFAAHQTWRMRSGRTPLIDVSAPGRAGRPRWPGRHRHLLRCDGLLLHRPGAVPAGRTGDVRARLGGDVHGRRRRYLAASLVPAWISARLGRQWPALGGVVMAAGYAVLGIMVTSGGAGHVAALTGPLLVIGVGMGMLTAPLTGIVLAQVMPQHVGTVSGLQATTVQLGNSVGVAVIGVVFFGALAGGFAHAFGAALAGLTALPLAAAVAIQFLPRRRG